MGMHIERKPFGSRQVFCAGVVAGLLAGATMGMVSMLMSWMMDQGFWMPLKKISVTLLGESAVQVASFEMLPVLTGVVIHFMTAVALGIFFSFMGGRLSFGSAVGSGVVFGLGVWAVMQFILLPIVNPVMAQMPYLQFVMLHVIFGATLGSYSVFLPSSSLGQVHVDPALRRAA